jgi:hypothetical protein
VAACTAALKPQTHGFQKDGHWPGGWIVGGQFAVQKPIHWLSVAGRLTGGRLRLHGCRLYSTKATSGRMYRAVTPPCLWMSWAGLGRRCRPSTQKATWRVRLGHSPEACAKCDVLRQEAAVLRYASRRIRTMRAQQAPRFPGIARDVLAPLPVAMAGNPGKM